jgi:hypothetical protein
MRRLNITALPIIMATPNRWIVCRIGGNPDTDLSIETLYSRKGLLEKKAINACCNSVIGWLQQQHRAIFGERAGEIVALCDLTP